MMNIKKAQLIKSLRSRYNVFSFNGFGQCTLTRNGMALKGEPRVVEIRVPESIGYALLLSSCN